MRGLVAILTFYLLVIWLGTIIIMGLIKTMAVG